MKDSGAGWGIWPKLFVLLVTIAHVCAVLPGDAKSDPLGEIINLIGKAAEQAAREKAYNKWKALSPDVLNCVIRIYRIDADALVQRGIGPDHPKVKPYVDQCKIAVAEAQRQLREQAERERAAALAAERERQRLEEERLERERLAREAEERAREAERQLLNKFKSDVRTGRSGYGIMRRQDRNGGICLEESPDAEVIAFAISNGRIAFAVSFAANGEFVRGAAGTMVGLFQRGSCGLLIASSRGLQPAVQLLDTDQLDAKPEKYWIETNQISAWRQEMAAAQAAEAERQRKLREEQLVIERRRQACLTNAKTAGYFAQVCKAEAFRLKGRGDLAEAAERAEQELRAKLTLCTDDDLVDVRAKARAAGSQVIASGAVGPLADVKSAVELACIRAK